MRVYCNNCQSQVLGIIDTNGNVVIMRNRQGSTIISAPQYTLACHCGYKVTVAGTTVISYEAQGYTYTS